MKSQHKPKVAKSLEQIFGIFNIRKLSKSMKKQKISNKRRLSAEGFLLLPSALRPRLLNVRLRDSLVPILLYLFPVLVIVVSVVGGGNASAVSLELTVPANFNIDLDPGVGTTFGESDLQQISIKTSGSYGYTLNIKPSDGTDLKNGENLIKTITKSEGYDSSDSYKNSNEANTWAYKPGKLSSVVNTKYLPFPSIETLLDKTDKNNDTANNYDLTIAAKVDNTLPSGTYSNNFVISATANTVSYSITYNLNEGEWNGTSPQTGTVTEDKIKLDSNTPTKENYEFLGWCSEPTSDENCDGETKQPGDEITLTNSNNQFAFYSIWKPDNAYKVTYELNSGSGGPSTPQTGEQLDGEITLDSNRPTKSNLYFTGWCNKPTDNALCPGKVYWPGEPYPLSDGRIVTMYALYAPLELKNLGSLGNMQNFDCNAKLTNVHNYGTVIDSRDNNSYSVARLKDGRCWMTQNLRIMNKTINSTNSDISSGSFTIPSSQLANFTSDSGNGYGISNSARAYLDTTYGGYYNFYTATASQGGRSFQNGNTTQSICPKGWRIPSQDDFNSFVAQYNNYDITSSPIFIKLNSGLTQGNSLIDTTVSFLHASTASYSESGRHYCSYQLNIYGAKTMGVAKCSYCDRECGKNIRCVSR